jgi:hypothetical protein
MCQVAVPFDGLQMSLAKPYRSEDWPTTTAMSPKPDVSILTSAGRRPDNLLAIARPGRTGFGPDRPVETGR